MSSNISIIAIYMYRKEKKKKVHNIYYHHLTETSTDEGEI